MSLVCGQAVHCQSPLPQEQVGGITIQSDPQIWVQMWPWSLTSCVTLGKLASRSHSFPFVKWDNTPRVL